MTEIPLHPDDVLFFHDVRDAMRTVAHRYKLGLRSVRPLTMPRTGMADRLGECSHDGRIQLVLRCTVNGAWEPNPMSPAEVWDTAAHELAHLRHFDHGARFHEFRQELAQALANLQEDHQEKVIRKLVKLQASQQSEASLGNTAAAEAFAGMVNRLLLEHELSPSSLDYARVVDHDPIVELSVDLGLYKIDEKKMRVAWQETLARVVAKAHLCTFFLRTGSNQIWFVGTRAHAVVAEYAFGVMVAAVASLAHDAYWGFRQQLRRERRPTSDACGFYASWLNGFIARVTERFEEARRAAVSEAPEGASTALMRLDGALAKVRQYTDDKFKGRSGASALNAVRGTHREGRAAGRAAANGLVLGRKGVGAGVKGLLK